VSATVYVAGPMNGYPRHNFPAFHAESARLRALGYEVLSPAEKTGEQAAIEAEQHGPEFRESQTYKDFLKADLRMVLDSDAVQLLPGWEHSRGATLEVHVARAVGIEVWEPHGSDPSKCRPSEHAETESAERSPDPRRQS
jgi:nucleoside 2-deoxyribosyltransferase